MSKPYVWYSGATDITGKKLAEALGCSHGATKPTSADVVICWGAKTKENTVFPAGVTVLNHPDRIRDNRDKLKALSTLKAAGVNVEEFTTNPATVNQATSGVKLPVVARTRYHQGGKGFWLCPTMTHMAAAAQEGAGYFQNFIEIKDEFRIHVFAGKVIYAVKKVKRTVEEMEIAYVEDEMIRQKSLAEKAGETFNEKAAESVIKRQAKKFAADGANTMIRSNRLGWKFKRVTSLGKELEDQAIKACTALGLVFGAVDACIDAKGKAWIIEVNTGPGLEETTFTTYVTALKAELKRIEDVAKAKKTTPLAAKVAATATKAATKTVEPAPAGKDGKKRSLLEKMALMREMAELASEDEAIALNSVFGKMFKKDE